jgi:hypothetical protein
VVYLWGRHWTRAELLARVGRPEQVGGIRLVDAGAELAGPAGNLDLLSRQMGIPEEVSDGKR